MRATPALLIGLLLSAATTARSADAGVYAKRDTWQNTWMAAREALARQEAAQDGQRAQVSGRPADERWSPWHHIGPFTSPGTRAFGFVFPPEKEIDLGKAYNGMKWQARPEWADGVVHELQTPGDSATYLYRTVTVPTARTLTGYFGSDDGMIFWLNGQKLISNDVPRGPSANSDTAKLQLAAGENRLLFKIHNGGGGCGFYFHTSPTPLNAPSPRSRIHDELWQQVERDFRDPESRRQMAWERQDRIWPADWNPGDFAALAERYAAAVRTNLATETRQAAKDAKDSAGLARVRALYYRSRSVEEAHARWKDVSGDSLRMAIMDLTATFGTRYPRGPEHLAKIEPLVKEIRDAAAAGDNDRFLAATRRFDEFRQEVFFSSPLIDFDRMLFIQRSPEKMGLPQNWQGNCALPRDGYDNELAMLSPVRPGGKIASLLKPAKGGFVGDVDLHWDADRMLFSMPGGNGRWQVFEMKTDGTGLRQVTPGEEKDVDNYDPCYLPNGAILYGSTAVFHGVPCVGGSNTVANLFRIEADGKTIRQLCFDQDHNWCPTVLNDGRVIYTRWEYSDTPHYFTRILFRMNPDGTNQAELYGSNSYWPNSIFYARPIPNDPTKVVGIISGHHGVARMGELVVFDPGRSQRESAGAVQRIPGHGKQVDAPIRDGLVEGSWPKFLHPYPLSDKYFLVSMQPTPNSNWAIYLADIFDNLVPLLEIPGYACLEPVPVKKQPKPPVVPDRVRPESREATVYISDVYQGDGLRGVPRGTVKKLRIYEPHYAYPGMGGHINIGVDGPWDVHRIHGTVPVYEDGSAAFVVPANTPLAVQPLDAEGRAVQVMRSWFTAMPGEQLACVGCHEQQNSNPPARTSLAFNKTPDPIQPWYGPARGLSFKRDVQPVLDKHCVGCHDGTQQPMKPVESAAADGGEKRDPSRPDFVDGVIPDFTRKDKNGWRNFTPAYLALHPYIRRPGPESDYHIQVPLEWHAGTSELVQMLKKGHHGVKLDAEAWDRLYTWIDLNVPDHGTWKEHRGSDSKMQDRRLEMRTKYANNTVDPEAIADVQPAAPAFVKPEAATTPKPPVPAVPGWPFDAQEAKKRQSVAGLPVERKIDLGDGLSLTFILIPAGEFVMGDADGAADETPTRVRIDKPFYMARCEVTNQQYSLFDPSHDSRFISVLNKDQGNPGELANRPLQPVIRISWKQAMAYSEWLSKKSGYRITLPTEAQWEYACRAGTNTPLNYGDIAADFANFANLADSRVENLARGDSPRWIPAVTSINDGSIVADHVGKFAPNAFGLCDMHGNVWEWTRTSYAPYPYRDDDGRNSLSDSSDKVVRGGSWYDRPYRARSAMRMAYRPWQGVFNVGFRVICEVD